MVTFLGELLASIVATVCFKDEQAFAYVPKRVVRRTRYKSTLDLSLLLELISRIDSECRDLYV